MTNICVLTLISTLVLFFTTATDAFVVNSNRPFRTTSSSLFATEEKAAPLVSGEELEVLLSEWDLPIVIDAFATWCGPCLLMAPEFEKAAQELKGKVRFAKLDTDKDEAMATRLNIMGLPTLLFLDKYTPKDDDDEENQEARAVLKGRIEGALEKDDIVGCCNHYFFDGPMPQIPS